MTPKPEMPKPDKYDEAELDKIISDIRKGRIITEEGGNAYFRHDLDPIQALLAIDAFLRRAFPSAPNAAESAEDARKVVDTFLDTRGVAMIALADQAPPRFYVQFRADLTAELEAFAESRVKPWREALKEAERLYTEYGLIANDPDCGSWINRVRELLSADDAKGGAK